MINLIGATLINALIYSTNYNVNYVLHISDLWRWLRLSWKCGECRNSRMIFQRSVIICSQRHIASQYLSFEWENAVMEKMVRNHFGGPICDVGVRVERCLSSSGRSGPRIWSRSRWWSTNLADQTIQCWWKPQLLLFQRSPYSVQSEGHNHVPKWRHVERNDSSLRYSTYLDFVSF